MGGFDTDKYVSPQLGPGLDARVGVRHFVQQQCTQKGVFWVALDGLPDDWRLPHLDAGANFPLPVPTWVSPAAAIAGVDATYAPGTVPRMPLIALDALSIVFNMFDADGPTDPGTRRARLALAVKMWHAEDAFYRSVGLVAVAVIDTNDGLAYFDSQNQHQNWRRSNPDTTLPPGHVHGNFGADTERGQLRRDFLRWLHVNDYPYYVHDHRSTGWVAIDQPLHADAACEYLMRHCYRGHPVLFGDAGDKDKFILQSKCVLAFQKYVSPPARVGRPTFAPWFRDDRHSSPALKMTVYGAVLFEALSCLTDDEANGGYRNRRHEAHNPCVFERLVGLASASTTLYTNRYKVAETILAGFEFLRERVAPQWIAYPNGPNTDTDYAGLPAGGDELSKALHLVNNTAISTTAPPFTGPLGGFTSKSRKAACLVVDKLRSMFATHRDEFKKFCDYYAGDDGVFSLAEEDPPAGCVPGIMPAGHVPPEANATSSPAFEYIELGSVAAADVAVVAAIVADARQAAKDAFNGHGPALPQHIAAHQNHDPGTCGPVPNNNANAPPHAMHVTISASWFSYSFAKAVFPEN